MIWLRNLLHDCVSLFGTVKILTKEAMNRIIQNFDNSNGTIDLIGSMQRGVQ